MREVVITGIGVVSCAGEGIEAHLQALADGTPPQTNLETFAPFPVHPVVSLDFDRQIPKKADQRQMEAWQRLGTYAAGLALDAAGAKADADLKARMHLIVSAGGGERDYAADSAILTGLQSAGDRGAYLNERLMSDLRPTLFLAQLSNLLAGNISIVHGITGASRTFMGEEQSGIDAIRIARARIASGQNDIMLVGGAYNAERADVLLVYEMGGYLWKAPYRPVFERPAAGGGLILGSGACFFVLEAREHAESRGATPMAAISGVATTRTRRNPGDVADALRGFWSELGVGAEAIVVSGATGVKGITDEEQEALRALAPGASVTVTGDVVGHTMEAQAPISVALAAALVGRGEAGEAVATSIGHRRGEGAVRLTALR